MGIRGARLSRVQPLVPESDERGSRGCAMGLAPDQVRHPVPVLLGCHHGYQEAPVHEAAGRDDIGVRYVSGVTYETLPRNLSGSGPGNLSCPGIGVVIPASFGEWHC